MSADRPGHGHRGCAELGGAGRRSPGAAAWRGDASGVDRSAGEAVPDPSSFGSRLNAGSGSRGAYIIQSMSWCSAPAARDRQLCSFDVVQASAGAAGSCLLAGAGMPQRYRGHAAQGKPLARPARRPDRAMCGASICPSVLGCSRSDDSPLSTEEVHRRLAEMLQQDRGSIGPWCTDGACSPVGEDEVQSNPRSWRCRKNMAAGTCESTYVRAGEPEVRMAWWPKPAGRAANA